MSGGDKANAKLAKAGDLDALVDLADGEGEGDIAAYTWLTVAADFGHDEAEDRIEALLESSSLQNDDDQLAVGNVHLELGFAYLTGTEGLPRDLARGQQHLEQAMEHGYPESANGAGEILRDMREKLSGEALDVFEAVYSR